MKILYISHAKKKATNFTLNFNLSLNEKDLKNWETQNKISINNYNKTIATNGTFSDSVRSF